MFLIDWLKKLFGLTKTPAKVQPVKAKTEPKKAAVAAGPKVTKASLNKLTKAQLEEEGRKAGVELDKRKKKADLVNELFQAIK